MTREMRLYFCNLESPYFPNGDVEDFRSCVDKHIPPALLYACRFWDDHLAHIYFEIDLFEQLRTFLKTKFLFWLEALSLTSNVAVALPALLALDTWLASGQGVSIVVNSMRKANY